MTVTSIQRDWGTEPNIVRMKTDSFIEDIVQDGWLESQQESINASNNGGFDWNESDCILVSYPLDQTNPAGQQAKTLLYVFPGFRSVNPISPIYPNLQNVTAYAAGGQPGATSVNVGINVITTASSAGASVILPLDVLSQSVIVANRSANSINVFPAFGDSINNLAVNTPFAVAAGSATIFIGVQVSNWATII
jgi:hypothetical protein